jgi:hypothetical protein
MTSLGWRYKSVLWLTLVVLMGCTLPTSPPALSAAAAQNTLDNWNPSYCKVVEFYGFYKPGEGGGQTLVAYVSLVNPAEHSQKQTIFAARFQLLNRSEGQQQWFLTSLTSHASGLSRRQGWDNLMIPVKTNSGAPST